MQKKPFNAHVDLEGNQISITTPSGGIEYRLHEHHALEDIVRGIRYAIMTSTSVGAAPNSRDVSDLLDENQRQEKELDQLRALLEGRNVALLRVQGRELILRDQVQWLRDGLDEILELDLQTAEVAHEMRNIAEGLRDSIDSAALESHIAIPHTGETVGEDVCCECGQTLGSNTDKCFRCFADTTEGEKGEDFTAAADVCEWRPDRRWGHLCWCGACGGTAISETRPEDGAKCKCGKPISTTKPDGEEG